MTLILNIFCKTSTESPFYSISPSFDTYGVFSFVIFVYLSALFFHSYRTTKSPIPVITWKKSLTFVVVYCLLMYPLHSIAQAAIYPGTIVKLGSESPPDDLAEKGEEFTFTSRLDGTVMNAYHQIHYGENSNTVVSRADASLVPAGEDIIPVVFLGGNGGTGWYNAKWGNDFIRRYLATNTAYFDVYSFSYRGYEPNDKHTIGEKNVIEDSISFINYVKDKFPNRRPILVSHSLGTGPTSAMTKHFQSDLSCVVFGMPFSTMTQTAQEVAYYSPMIYLYLVNRWNSAARVKEMSKDVPVVVLSGGLDELIPPHHQKAMFEAVNSDDKLFSYVEDAYHMDIMTTIDNIGSEYDDWFLRGCMARSNM